MTCEQSAARTLAKLVLEASEQSHATIPTTWVALACEIAPGALTEPAPLPAAPLPAAPPPAKSGQIEGARILAQRFATRRQP